MKQYKSVKVILLAAAVAVATPCATNPQGWSWTTIKTKAQEWWQAHQGAHTPIFIVATATGATALVGLIWWLAQDRRTDEQVITDAQCTCQTTIDKYLRMITVVEETQLASHKTMNEVLLVKLIDSGVDCYYLDSLDNTIVKLNKENDTLSTRIARAQSEQLNKRMQKIQQDIFALVTRLNGLHTFIHYHMGYIELYKTAAHLQETYGQARVYQRSQTDLLTYVRANSSVFVAYPYFDFVEKAERAINTLKSHLHAASYAQSTDLVHDAQELLNDLIVIKGTLASTQEYRDDVHKREVARIQREKEAAEQARIQAEQQRDAMAALATKAQAEAERMRIQAEQQRVALERQKLEEQKKAQHKKEHAIQQQKVELERAKLASQQEAVRREQERLERERAAAQQAQYDAWHRAREAAYQQQMPQPSAPPAEEPAYNYEHNVPQPSVPPVDEKEEDLDAVFANMDKDLKFETQETEQFQKDHGIEDVE